MQKLDSVGEVGGKRLGERQLDPLHLHRDLDLVYETSKLLEADPELGVIECAKVDRRPGSRYGGSREAR